MLGHTIGLKIIELDEVDSTNSVASRLLFDGEADEGTVVMAKYQNAGKGQRGSKWESEAGKNLLVSFVLKPTFLSPTDFFKLNQMISLAVFDFLSAHTSTQIRIKWPNDMMAANKKIAGILVENTIRNNQIVSTIAGVGININQSQFKDYYPKAISLSLLESQNFDIKKLLDSLISFINKWYLLLQSGQIKKINDQYNLQLYRLNETATYETMGMKFAGIIRGTNQEGKLIISHSDNNEITFENKEVKFIY